MRVERLRAVDDLGFHVDEGGFELCELELSVEDVLEHVVVGVDLVAVALLGVSGKV